MKNSLYPTLLTIRRALVCIRPDLIVEVGLECQLGRALDASEAAAVEEGEVLEGSDLVRRVDRLCAS